MNIIIPMAGYGHRFEKAGYKNPKPLIDVNGRAIIEYVLDIFNRDNDNFIFICNKEHVNKTNIKPFLSSCVKNSLVCTIDNHKLGPVWTVKNIFNLIQDNSPVLFSHCDSPFTWNYSDFKKYIDENNPDGCLINHIGFHPHNLLPGIMAHCKVYGDKILEVKEKGCFTDKPMSEPASSGAYYFKSGSLVKKYFTKTIDQNLNYNGEFYITLVYNLLIRDGLDVRSYLCDQMISLGTPIEVENFIAWSNIIKSDQCKNDQDAANCYKFWRKFYETKNIE